MQFFLDQILARFVAIYLGVDCWRKLSSAFRERQIMSFNADLLNWWSRSLVRRDASPVQFWIEVGIQTAMLVSCVFVAIFGWWRPGP